MQEYIQLQVSGKTLGELDPTSTISTASTRPPPSSIGLIRTFSNKKTFQFYVYIIRLFLSCSFLCYFVCLELFVDHDMRFTEIFLCEEHYRLFAGVAKDISCVVQLFFLKAISFKISLYMYRVQLNSKPNQLEFSQEISYCYIQAFSQGHY